MPIYTDGPIIRQNQTLEEFETPLGDYLGAKFEQALDFNPLNLAADARRFREAQDNVVGNYADPFTGFALGELKVQPKPRISADEIKLKSEQAGVQIDIPAEGLTAEATDILIERRRRQMIQNDAINRSPDGARSFAGFGVQLGASLLDPLNIGLAFVPVVGQARYVGMLAKAGSATGRAGVRVGIGAAEGAAGVAAFEPFAYKMHQSLQDDYSALDSLINIGFGSALGGGLHVVGGATKDAMLGRWWEPSIPPAPKIEETTVKLDGVDYTKYDAPTFQRMQELPAAADGIPAARFDPNSAAAVTEAVSPQTREAALRTAVAQAIDGRAVDIEPVIRADASSNARQIDLPAFKQWFAESKVVDEAGEPIVVYHGTTKNFDTFSPESHFGTKAQANSILSYNQRIAEGSQSVVPAYLSIKKPKRLEDAQGVDWSAEVAKAKAEGYDGIVYQNWGEFDPDVNGMPRDSYVAFEPTQIKSAIGNSGAFDPNSGSLTDQIQSSMKRQTSPESVRVADPKASEAATERLATAPKSESLADAEAELARVMTDLQELYVPVEQADVMLRDLKPFDDAIKSSEELGRAARAAAICDLRA